jgi:hypothetical protein
LEDRYWYTTRLYRSGRRRSIICAGYLWKNLNVPENTTAVWAVFTDKRVPDACNFTINPPVSPRRDHWPRLDVYQAPDRADVKGVNTLMPGAMEELARHYHRGYRYVHFEYWGEE